MSPSLPEGQPVAVAVFLEEEFFLGVKLRVFKPSIFIWKPFKDFQFFNLGRSRVLFFGDSLDSGAGSCAELQT
jgi:hypothetical protein